jgi:hypothetical protein
LVSKELMARKKTLESSGGMPTEISSGKKHCFPDLKVRTTPPTCVLSVFNIIFCTKEEMAFFCLFFKTYKCNSDTQLSKCRAFFCGIEQMLEYFSLGSALHALSHLISQLYTLCVCTHSIIAASVIMKRSVLNVLCDNENEQNNTLLLYLRNRVLFWN